MAKNLTEVCTLLVDEYLGSIASEVFEALTKLGRVTTRDLIQHSGIPSRRAKYGLFTLVQHFLVFHHSPDDSDATFYEPNWHNAYALVRSGKISSLASSKLGPKAGRAVSRLISLGHARASDITDTENVHIQISNKNGYNSADSTAEVVARGSRRKTEHSHEVLAELVNRGYILQVQESHFRSPTEIDNEAQRDVMARKFPDGLKGGKQLAEFNYEVNQLKRKWRWDSSGPETSFSHARSRDYMSFVPRKRARVDHQGSNGVTGSHFYEEDAARQPDPVDANLRFRVNHEKWLAPLRNLQLVGLATRYIGETTAKVYAAALLSIESKVSRCYDELDDPGDDPDDDAAPTTTTLDVMSHINPQLDLRDGLELDGPHSNEDCDTEGDSAMTEPHPTTGRTAQGKTGGVDRLQKMELLRRHLRLLSSDPRVFLRRSGSRGGGEWKVDFRSLTRTLVQFELENNITARFGGFATRIIRILEEKGKLDEKRLGDFALLRPKDMRATLTTLQEHGFLEILPVPRDSNRQTVKTFFLWYYDQDRCRRLVLNDTLKAMARIIQRARAERSKVQSVVEKSERTDVIGNEEKYLSAAERKALEGWKVREEKLLTQLFRQDDLVLLLGPFMNPS